MNIIKKKLSELKPADYNPRKISKEELTKLKDSIEKFGYVEPVIWNKRTEHVVGGHQRLKVLENLGMNDIEVVEVDLDEVQEKALNLALNKISGEWDEDKLKELLLNLESQDKEILKYTGFDEKELLKLIPKDVVEDEFELHKEPKYKINRGEVWKLGNHRIMCGDSTNKANVGALMGQNKAILMVTDPPYGVSYDPKWRDDADKKGILGNRYPTRALGNVTNDDKINWTEAYALFNGDVVYVYHAGKYAAEVATNLINLDFEIINQIIWVKPHFALSRGDYHWRHEPCWYAVKKGKSHNWQGSRTEDTVWEIAGMNAMGASHDKADERSGHGTQKPIECMKRPIKNNTQEGDIVYDPFGGSGSTLIACEQLNRKCYMMEIDEFYCSVIIERWENLTGKKAIKIEETK